MKLDNLRSSSHTVGQSAWHFEWCTKYRYKMFKQEKYKNTAEAALRDAAQRHGIVLRELAVAPDHCHTAVELPPTMSPSKAMGLLKGASAYEIFRAEPKFRLRYPRGHLWSRGKFYRSAGDAALETIDNYVRHHDEKQTTLKQFPN